MAGVPDLLHAGRENDLSVFQENNIVQKLLDVRNQVWESRIDASSL